MVQIRSIFSNISGERKFTYSPAVSISAAVSKLAAKKALEWSHVLLNDVLCTSEMEHKILNMSTKSFTVLKTILIIGGKSINRNVDGNLMGWMPRKRLPKEPFTVLEELSCMCFPFQTCLISWSLLGTSSNKAFSPCSSQVCSFKKSPLSSSNQNFSTFLSGFQFFELHKIYSFYHSLIKKYSFSPAHFMEIPWVLFPICF